MKRFPFLLPAISIALVACDTQQPTQPLDLKASFEISDAAHNGNEHFYWLPPMVPNPGPKPTGTFLGGLSPTVEICEWADSECVLGGLYLRFTTSSGPGSEMVRVGEDHYIVNWHTNEFGLDVETPATYRIRVLLGVIPIGWADVQFAATGGLARSLTTEEMIGLKDGRTLPIKFRIETQATLLDLGNSEAADDDPSLLRALDGDFYLTFLSDRAAGGNNDLWITRSENGVDWSEPVRITDHPDADWFPTLMQSPDGVFHLVWFRAMQQYPFEQHIFYSRSYDGLNWDPSDEVQVTSGAVDDWAPSSVLSSSGELLVYFASQARSSNATRDLYLTRSSDGGATWQSPEHLEGPSSTDHEVFPWVVERNVDDYAMVFQRYDAAGTGSYFDVSSDIYLSTSNDGTLWSEAQQITVDASDDQVDAFPSLFWAPLDHQWILGWTSTSFSNPPRGDMVEFPLDEVGSYPAGVINRSTLNSVPGWSVRVASTPTPGTILMVWVSNITGTPRLWSQLVER